MADTAQLVYAPLGGAGEIGMNMYLYGYGPARDRRWIMVDCGIGFGDMETSPGVELMVPDIGFIAQMRDRLDGIFITHAHEDHVGAIGRLWDQLKAPVFATGSPPRSPGARWPTRAARPRRSRSASGRRR